jgi:heat shock protein HtpX
LFNAAAALSATTGVTPPELYVVDDTAINAMAVQQRSGAAIVATTGLLEHLDVVEVEAVLALLFQRIKSQELLAQTFVVPTVGAAAVFAEHFDDKPGLRKLLLSPMPLIERVLTWLHPADAEFDVDIAATLITRYPPALASALQKMDGHSALAMGTPVTAHLWLAPPVNVSLLQSGTGLHKPLSERVAVLQEL